MRKLAFIHMPLFCRTRSPKRNADVAQIEVTFGRVSMIDLGRRRRAMTAPTLGAPPTDIAIGLGVHKHEMGHSSDVRLDGCRLRDRTVGTVWFAGLLR
jgi:hypothetical protein